MGNRHDPGIQGLVQGASGIGKGRKRKRNEERAREVHPMTKTHNLSEYSKICITNRFKGSLPWSTNPLSLYCVSSTHLSNPFLPFWEFFFFFFFFFSPTDIAIRPRLLPGSAKIGYDT